MDEYRGDFAAAQARIEALEAELREARRSDDPAVRELEGAHERLIAMRDSPARKRQLRLMALGLPALLALPLVIIPIQFHDYGMAALGVPAYVVLSVFMYWVLIKINSATANAALNTNGAKLVEARRTADLRSQVQRLAARDRERDEQVRVAVPVRIESPTADAPSELAESELDASAKARRSE